MYCVLRGNAILTANVRTSLGRHHRAEDEILGQQTPPNILKPYRYVACKLGRPFRPMAWHLQPPP
jgi:hypothetical protein